MMQPSVEIIRYELVALIAAILVKRILTRVSTERKIPALLKAGAVIIDVRSPGEFAAGARE
jgi:hypothetical protein